MEKTQTTQEIEEEAREEKLKSRRIVKYQSACSSYNLRKSNFNALNDQLLEAQKKIEEIKIKVRDAKFFLDKAEKRVNITLFRQN